MKTFCITLFSLLLTGLNPTTETINATFTGFVDGYYYFEDEDELVYSFESIKEPAALKYDLMDDSHKGKVFKITYTVSTELNDDDEEYDVLSIDDIELIK